MIGRISGVLAEKSPPTVLVDVGGVGYLIDVPMSTFFQLPSLGERVVLLTHQVVREDAHLLFGFLSERERHAFLQLLRISGIGPRSALSVLSGLSVDELAAAVTRQDAARLTKVPGIGKKTAERLLLELKGRLGGEASVITPTPADATSTDILQALLALGYSEKEAQAALKPLPADVSVSEGIKLALRALSR
jgi:Holliday junction DNA helicase RuvA